MSLPDNLTKSQALFIAYLRIRCNGSWRWVAAKFSERYFENKPFKLTSTVGGNQLEGLVLCNLASNILNIKID